MKIMYFALLVNLGWFVSASAMDTAHVLKMIRNGRINLERVTIINVPFMNTYVSVPEELAIIDPRDKSKMVALRESYHPFNKKYGTFS